MSIIDWFFIGLIVLFFLTIMFFSWSDLVRDILYYKEKKKNVKSMEAHKSKKRKNYLKKNVKR